MLKKLMVIILMAALAFAILPAGARVRARHVSFSAQPCTVTCPWFVNTGALPSDATKVDPATYDPLDVVLTDIKMGCTSPGPEGTYDDIRVRVPRGMNWLIFDAWPVVDWDIFVCSGKRGPGDRFHAYSANSMDPEGIDDEISRGEGICSAGVGCAERISMRVRPGRRYILRAYNWADAEDLRARYVFRRF